jgi:hypothetical protein
MRRGWIPIILDDDLASDSKITTMKSKNYFRASHSRSYRIQYVAKRGRGEQEAGEERSKSRSLVFPPFFTIYCARML